MTQHVGTFILATVGTSLVNHLQRELASQGLPPKQEALALLKKWGPTDLRCGAEVNSIEHLLAGRRLSTGDTVGPYEIAFLVSDTEDGNWTGTLLESYYRSRGFQEVTCHEVPGLSPIDPDRFARQGLRSLVKESSRLLKDAERKRLFRVINATGGFKAQISFAGLIGQTLGVPVVYQFEGFPTCIEMPPMPVDFDREIWLMNYDVFMKLSEAGELTEEEFPFKDLDPVIRDLLESVEVDGKCLYCLSPILELMHQGFLARPDLGAIEPPTADRAPGDVLRFNKSELPHAPVGAEGFALALGKKFAWITEIRNVEFMNSQRTHLLLHTGELSVHDVCFSDGTKGIRLRVKTTGENERHRAFVRRRLAEFCHHR
jgi:putative CRISPR-associated protein (TIGR02619 family)